MIAEFRTDRRRKIKKVFSIFLLFVFVITNFFGLGVNTAHATDAWWNPSYGYRVKITVNASQVPSTQTNFPVYVNLANLPAGFFSHVKSDGGDIRVTNSAGTELAREIVAINTGASTGELWFKASSISNSSYFYIYYGNSGAYKPAATDANGSQHVWDDGGVNNYKGVWHLADPTNPIDSLGVNNGTNHGVTATTGQIGGAGSFDGTSKYISAANTGINNLTSFTLSAWANATFPMGSSLPTVGCIVAGGGSSNRNFQMCVGKAYGEHTGLEFYSVGVGEKFSSNVASVDGLHHYVETYTGGTIKFYQDGVLINSIGSLAALNTGNSGLNIGLDFYGTYFKGFLDEVRISNTARSADWISTEYNNQFSATAFYSVAGQEAVTVADTPTITSAVRGNAQVNLSWTAPSNGGSPITDYVYEWEIHNSGTWNQVGHNPSTNLYATITGLTNGISYDFRVSAVNALGTGSHSATVTVIPATVPSAPAKGIATKGNASASVAFSPPQ